MRAFVYGLVFLVLGCATSPLGRSQLILFPEAQIQQMGVTAFRQIKQETELATDSSSTGYVRCVALAITGALPPGGVDDWEVTVFDEDLVNAFALPGGKIGVYTGLLDVTESQGQLATVLGHEVAHVLAQHSNERVSTTYVTQTGLQVAQIAAGANTPQKQQLFALLGLGAQVGVLLPFSRTQESEADLIGLDLMARAGFDPRQSVALWHNMAAAGGPAPPEYLSTHPASETRIENLRERMDHAMPLYRQARAQGRRPDCA